MKSINTDFLTKQEECRTGYWWCMMESKYRPHFCYLLISLPDKLDSTLGDIADAPMFRMNLHFNGSN